ncbi:integrase core domain-containing protein [Aeromonas veronii]|uniref:integrase core domain-containing protein n=1 Tax=Aeromonas veronii TaxID=654 RepID=UPI0030073E90
MTTNEKVARRKLSLLELAKELNNVSKACKLIGYSRQQFYEIRRNYQTYGAEGLLDKLPGCKGAHPNRVAPEIEQAILDYSLTRPIHGPLRVAQELAPQGINVSAGGVRGVVYLQTVLDCYSRHAWGRLYTSKLPITSVHVLNETVLPFFETHEARVYTILSDNGREFCGRPDHHPYELFLQLEWIEHRTTKVRRPQSNGFIERLHRTLLDEHFRIKGRTTWYESVEQMQTDLDSYLEHYNTQRPHQGRMMEGQTP